MARLSPAPGRGFVSLVGAGPGDPGLLTLKAVGRLRRADSIYHDALIDPAILAHARADAKLIDVGKRRGAAPVAQREIEAALIRDALAGLQVVRLKGGDPFLFGRGGEEALALRRHDISFEVIPGVSSGTSVPAAASIPLTHRGLARSVAFLTAHDLASDMARERLGLLARGADTLVLFMAGAELQRAQEALQRAGISAATPAALIENGSLENQRVARGTAGELARLGEGRGDGPVLIVIGATVAIADSLRTTELTPESFTSIQKHGIPPDPLNRSLS
jgi:uroporphyrin-III C-methyltransferase